MEPNSLKWVGSSCGLHGPYVFYKAFQFLGDGRSRILSLGDFFFVRCKPEDPVCIAELQLLWEERTSRQLLSSSKLYFLPEDTPQGRTVTHGEHEVIAVSEKVIVRLEDLVKWSVQDWSAWTQGLKTEPLKPSIVRELGTNGRREALHRYRESTVTSGLNFKDVQRERALLGQDEDEQKILVLSYPQYCRYRSILARLAEPSSSLLINHTVLALGGIAALGGHINILYCRDTFDHPTLMQNESICDHFAPNLKGRPRKKKLSFPQRRYFQNRNQSQGPSSRSLQSSASVPTQELCCRDGKNSSKLKHGCRKFANGNISTTAKPKSNGLSKKISAEEEDEEQEEKSDIEEKKVEEISEESRAEEQAFLVSLYKYMKNRDTPIERIPFLGFKQINLWTMFQAAQKLGGYELITVRRQWKHVYDELGGNPSSTSAATCTRRHYERLLLPYERNLRGEQDKPLPLVKPRKPESSQEKGSVVRSKKAKVHNSAKLGGKKEKVETAEGAEQTQNFLEKEENVPEQGSSQGDQPIIIEEEEEEELHLTLKKEESLSTEQTPSFCPTEPDCRAPASSLTLGAGLEAGSEWRQITKALQVKLTCGQQSGGHFIPKNSYLLHPWDQNRPGGHVILPETYVQVQEPTEKYGGRVGKVLPMCKQACLDLSTESKDFGAKLKESSAAPVPTAAYCKSSQGVMSPLAKKKLLSQVCESTPFSFATPGASCISLKLGTQTEDKNNKSDEEGKAKCVSDSVQEVAAVFRPSVIHHAQSSKAQAQTTAAGGGEELSEAYSCRSSLHLQPTWQPYLHRGQSQDSGENCGEKLLQVPSAAQPHSYTTDCYSSPHLHSLYRQTESCLNSEPLGAIVNGDREESRGFVCGSVKQEGRTFRSHFGDRTPITEGSSQEGEEEPRDFTVPKPLSQRVSSFPNLPYPVIQPKACRVPPMTKHSSAESASSFPNLNTSSEPSLVAPVRPSKRSIVELDNEEVSERKVLVVTPIHPVGSVRHSDPEDLKPAEPGHVVHLPEGHSSTTFTPAHLYSSMYSAGAQEGLQQHPGLRYLKSQTAVSPLVFHPMLLHPQHFYRHPGGATLYGDLLHHLYPVSTLPPPQLSSVHPSTRL